MIKKVLAVLLVWFVLLTGVGVLSGDGLVYEDTDIVTVGSGDTVWDIATSINDGSYNTQELVYEIRQLNELESVVLSIGQEIKVPILKGGE